MSTETPQTEQKHTPKSKLSPCPFCGCDSVRSNKNQTTVLCHNCGARGPIMIPEGEHEREWNKRALTGIQDPEGTLAEVREALSAAADSLGYFHNSEFWNHTHTADYQQVVGALAKLSAISPKV